jgi:O-antigen/teichoic acid export membrane protein
MSQFQKFARNVGLMGITQIILGLQAFLLLPILTKFLGATDFGIWSQIKITVTLLGGLAVLGLDTAIIRFISGQHDKEKVSKEMISVLSISAFSAIIFGVIVYLFSNKIGFLLTHIISSNIYFKFIILILLVEVIYNIFLNFIRAKENVKLFFIIEVSKAIFELLLIYIFLSKDRGLFGIITVIVLVKTILIIIGMLNIKKEIKITKPSFESIKPYLSFSLPLIMVPLLTWIIQLGDQYIIGFYLGAKAVGIYGLAYSLCFIIRSLIDPIYMILGPALSKAWNQDDKNAVRLYFKYSYKYVFMLAIPAMFGLNMLAKPIIRIISTNEFVEGSILIPFISAGFILYCFWQLGGHFLHLKKETKKFTKVILLLVLVNIILNILLIPWIGYLGAAISTLITFGIAAGFGIKLIRSMGFSLMGNFLFKCTFSSCLMSVTILIIRNMLMVNEIVKLIIIIFVSVIVYFSTLFLLKGISKDELKFLKKIILSIKE